MDPEIHAAWKEIMAKYQLESDPFSNVQDCVRIFGFGAAAFLQSYPLILRFVIPLSDPVFRKTTGG
jgi:hypothetical protein